MVLAILDSTDICLLLVSYNVSQHAAWRLFESYQVFQTLFLLFPSRVCEMTVEGDELCDRHRVCVVRLRVIDCTSLLLWGLYSGGAVLSWKWVDVDLHPGLLLLSHPARPAYDPPLLNRIVHIQHWLSVVLMR